MRFFAIRIIFNFLKYSYISVALSSIGSDTNRKHLFLSRYDGDWTVIVAWMGCGECNYMLHFNAINIISSIEETLLLPISGLVGLWQLRGKRSLRIIYNNE